MYKSRQIIHLIKSQPIIPCYEHKRCANVPYIKLLLLIMLVLDVKFE